MLYLCFFRIIRNIPEKRIFEGLPILAVQSQRAKSLVNFLLIFSRRPLPSNGQTAGGSRQSWWGTLQNIPSVRGLAGAVLQRRSLRRLVVFCFPTRRDHAEKAENRRAGATGTPRWGRLRPAARPWPLALLTRIGATGVPKPEAVSGWPAFLTPVGRIVNPSLYGTGHQPVLQEHPVARRRPGRVEVRRGRDPFPHPAHRTGRAVFPHPALGQGSDLDGRHAFAHGRLRVRVGSRISPSCWYR